MCIPVRGNPFWKRINDEARINLHLKGLKYECQTHQLNTYSKLTIETLEQGVEYLEN